MDEYTRKTTYDHPHTQKQRAEKKITTQNSVEILRARHRGLKSEQARQLRAERQELQRNHDNEIAHDASHHGGRGRGDREREKEMRALDDQHQRKRDDLDVQLDKEMAAAKKKRAAELE
jgi:hypothetical protein